MGEFLDDNIVCPVSGGRLEPVGASPISAASGRRYAIDDGIPRLFVDDAEGVEAPIPDLARGDRVTHAVQTFYEDAPFPNYNDFNSLETFVRRADAGIFARLLREQVPMNSTVLEVGCRTGQLINYLGATTMARVYAADMTLPSLELGHAFATQHGINGVRFMQMNLFRPCIREVSMDFVVSNGVLHHTADARRAFLSIARLVKPGGFILVGLYDKIGRLRTDFRRVLYRHFGEWVLALDPHLRRNLSPAKRRAWIQDQYRHPQETKHTMSETLEWFAAAGFSFVSSIPGITKRLSASERLFEPHDLGTA
ncbi:MAG: methyltransferase domain-containing protein, partial [Alphaproteobacteria bacterium]|nr:methyltransferase domain-containing protein [Alphaproteobacteria bacterium]